MRRARSRVDLGDVRAIDAQPAASAPGLHRHLAECDLNGLAARVGGLDEEIGNAGDHLSPLLQRATFQPFNRYVRHDTILRALSCLVLLRLIFDWRRTQTAAT